MNILNVSSQLKRFKLICFYNVFVKELSAAVKNFFTVALNFSLKTFYEHMSSRYHIPFLVPVHYILFCPEYYRTEMVQEQ